MYCFIQLTECCDDLTFTSMTALILSKAATSLVIWGNVRGGSYTQRNSSAVETTASTEERSFTVTS